MKVVSIPASQFVDHICFFCVRKHDDGTGMVVAAPMTMHDITYLLNSTRKEGSRERYFIDESNARAYLKMWEASQRTAEESQ
jgi:hypothetical protein